jgi:DNA modification methylase
MPKTKTKPQARKRSAKPAATPRSDAQPPEPEQPTIRIEQWAIARLKPYERNPRKNDGEPVAKMIASIKEFGFAVPVLAQASDGLVIDGHLRLKAAVAMHLASVPVIPCDGWSEAQVRAFRIMVNRSVSWSEFDPELLALEFAELKALEFDLTLTGFDQKELVSFMAGTANAAEDDMPPVPETPVSRAGDLWLLGGGASGVTHRLLCGDSTNAADVERLMDGAKADMLTGDPPYGVNYSGGKGKDREEFENDSKDHDTYRQFVSASLNAWAGHITEKGPLYLWFSDSQMEAILAAVAENGWKRRCLIQWCKSHWVMGRAVIHYHQQNEPCVYAAQCPTLPNWHGPFNEKTVWEFDKPVSSDDHPTQKPVELYRRAITNSTRPGELVAEMFLGSGTTLLAAELTERICYGLEIAPAYCDVIVTRWQTLTSKAATLDGDGRTFADVAAERINPNESAPAPNTSRPIKGKRA